MLSLGVPLEPCLIYRLLSWSLLILIPTTNFHRVLLERTQDFIYLTLMASWLVDLPWQPARPLDVIEYYAGAARVSRIASAVGFESRAFDIDFDKAPLGIESTHSGRCSRSAFDINGEGGFLLLGHFKAKIL